MTWFLTSRLGRALAGGFALLLALATFGASERRKGRAQAAAKAKDGRIEAMERAKDVRNEVQGMDDARVGGELNRWMRDGDSSD